MSRDRDYNLIQAWLGGDRDSGNKLIDENRDRVAKFVRLQTMDFPEEISEDITDEAFCRALKDSKKFNGTSTILTWVCGYAINCIKEIRKNKIVQVPLDELENNVLNRYDDSMYGDPANIVVHKEEAESVLLAFKSLPEHYQIVIYLRTIEDRKFKEVAMEMGISLEAVVSLWRRAINELKKLFYKR